MSCILPNFLAWNGKKKFRWQNIVYENLQHFLTNNKADSTAWNSIPSLSKIFDHLQANDTARRVLHFFLFVSHHCRNNVCRMGGVNITMSIYNFQMCPKWKLYYLAKFDIYSELLSPKSRQLSHITWMHNFFTGIKTDYKIMVDKTFGNAVHALKIDIKS